MPAEHLQQALLAFFDREQRKLPWRESRDAYRIWISEVMLQQTQVVTVLPYYRAFLTAFPSVEVLAAADLEEVIARWSGLGYYRRARQLHVAAQAIAAAGAFPASAAAWQELPGIGPYTAAAIASQALGEVIPVMDGNVERVISRRLALSADPKRRAVRLLMLAAAAELLDPLRPGDGNQALMELGATVCRPRQPLCLFCPLAEGCLGKGSPESYPAPRPSRPGEKMALTLVVVRREGQVLFFRRPQEAPFLAGMWELPGAPTGDTTEIESTLGSIYGGRFQLQQPRGSFRHAITYRRLEVTVFEANWSGRFRRESCWASDSARAKLGLSSMFEKALAR